ncbi:Alpha/Beta hydrolase protein [Mycena albidolilacea]|uniref:Carboxylic ester hydrolase n=1 Tax=Mycena albidolilacea TaxID=1033008 RepID=A0AAD6ZAP7_9AGAR|nr:Alpha/Beta hydrolase protein [Mycena albidolilacea]
MSPISSNAILGAALLLLVSSCAAHAPVVDLGYAQYEGVVDTDLDVTKFLGIRYAAPPTGDLRWRAPTAPSKLHGIQQAAIDPPQCIQGSNFPIPTNPLIPQSEDCLFLSVYSPALNSTRPLPTIVWIHGGGYVWGSASEYNGTEIVVESNRQVVVVVIQYRLGLFGFLAGKEVKDGGAPNAGLLDQDFALRWVNQNIRKFGGDPDKVAIWGESAGAGSVIQQVIAHNGKTEPQLFRAAITSSTYLPPQYRYSDQVPQKLFNNISAQARCADANALECLRAVDSTLLQEINENVILASFFGTTTFGPVVDGSFIAQSPTDALEQGLVNGDILLSVTNAHEGTIFVNQSEEFDIAQYAQQLFPLFGAKEGEAVASTYRSLGFSLEQADAIMGEALFICPTYVLLDAFRNQSYKGEYAVGSALHGSDVFYYFPSFTFPGTELSFNNTAFIDGFADGFLSFAVNLDPNDKLQPTVTPTWPKWSSTGAVEMVFNRTEAGDLSIVANPTSPGLLNRCEFWKSLRNLTAQ